MNFILLRFILLFIWKIVRNEQKNSFFSVVIESKKLSSIEIEIQWICNLFVKLGKFLFFSVFIKKIDKKVENFKKQIRFNFMFILKGLQSTQVRCKLKEISLNKIYIICRLLNWRNLSFWWSLLQRTCCKIRRFNKKQIVTPSIKFIII
jgi:hypothetical protein